MSNIWASRYVNINYNIKIYLLGAHLSYVPVG